MTQHTERIIVGAAIGVLGALAVGIKVVEGVNSWLRWQVKGEPIVVDTASNGGVSIADELHRYGSSR